MSDNITKEQKLTALVLSYASNDPRDCALVRAAKASNVHIHLGYDLVEFAKSLGFTEGEAKGIMNGWDMSRGCSPVFVDYDTAGYVLGKKLHKTVFGG